MKHGVGVLGYFGYSTNKLDGQTVKTRQVYELLCKHFKDVKYYDTEVFKMNRFSILSMFYMVTSVKQLVYMPAYGNLKYMFPIVWVISKIFRTKIYYVVIGGWLCDFIRHLPVHRFMLKRIKQIFSETKYLKEKLKEDYEMKNVTILPNFRLIDFTPLMHHTPDHLNVVFMARICKKKGLDVIFSLGAYIKENSMNDKISIDFWGQITPQDKEYFKNNIVKYPFMKYRGTLYPEKIHQQLQLYDVLVLPTHYMTEGLPGSLIDAYFSGIPVIASNWRYARELIDDKETGLIIPFENGTSQFINAVLLLYKNEKLLDEMKKKAFAKSKNFGGDRAWSILSEGMNV